MAYALEGDRTWLDRWQSQDRPDPYHRHAMQNWLDGLRGDPLQHPSARSERQHPHPMDELRGALLLDAGPAFVAYSVTEEEKKVRVLYIGKDPPEGMVFPPP